MKISPRWQAQIPWLLVRARLALAPIAVLIALTHGAGWLWNAQFLLAALSDLYDGKLARRWGVVSPSLRQADSVADTVYVVGVILSLWIAHPQIVLDHLWGIALVGGLEAARYPLDWWRFGRGASYHALSAKLFGVGLLVAIPIIMGTGAAGPWLWIALGLGLISELEGVAISLVLPEWTHDVRHLGVALRARAEATRAA